VFTGAFVILGILVKKLGLVLTVRRGHVRSEYMFLCILPLPLTFNFMFLLSCTTICRGNAWVADYVVGANDASPWVECSNKGTCDRDTG
jgi:hypothetical protein